MPKKPDLQPPSQPRKFVSDPKTSRLKSILFIGLIVLAAIAFIVLKYSQPVDNEPVQNAIESVSKRAEKHLPLPEEKARPQLAKQEAEEKARIQQAKQKAEEKAQIQQAKQEAEEKAQAQLAKQKAEEKAQAQLAKQEAEEKILAQLAKQEAEEKILAQLAKQEAEEKAQLEVKILQQKSEELLENLESDDVQIWGKEHLITDYSEVLTLKAKADTYLDERHLKNAKEAYRETISNLEQLSSSRPERIKRAINSGYEAYKNLDSELAKENFKIALSADSKNIQAKKGLSRAEVLPQVLDFIKKGKRYESNNDLDNARRMYAKGVSLDKEFNAVNDLLRKVDVSIQKRDYRMSISKATTALRENKIDEAKQALNQARKLQTETKEVVDIQQQIKTAESRNELQGLREKAIKQEKNEQFEEILKTFDKALEIDKNAVFAKQGKLRFKKFLELDQQIKNYLSKPEMLLSEKNRNFAGKIYDLIVARNDIGPKLADKADKLNSLIKLYDKPVSVLIKSDNKTNISIYRVGRYGSFLENLVKLKPGRYKVLGTRSGFRDVISILNVPVNKEKITFKISCEEKI